MAPALAAAADDDDDDDDLDLDPMTLIYELDPDILNVYLHIKVKAFDNSSSSRA